MIFQLSTYQIIVVVITLLISLSIHEWAHAGAPYLMGDSTAKNQGRLSLNPLVHIDPFGFLAILLVGFGWAKPVRIDPRNFKHPKRAEIFVALAGPLSNLLLASLLLRGLLHAWFPYSIPLPFSVSGLPIAPIVSMMIQLNLVLFVFNMIPIPPLDGSHLIMALIPEHMQQTRRSFQHYGQMALLAILVLGAVFNYRFLPISTLTNALIQMLGQFLSP